METIKPNSHKYKEEQANNEKVPDTKLAPVIAAGKARIQKKSGFSLAAKSIISDDAKNVKSYIILDVLIPTFKKAVSDIVTNGIDIVLYGKSGRTSKKGSAGRVSYRDCYNKPEDRFTRSSTSDRTDNYVSRKGPATGFNDVVVDTRAEAEDILSRMSEYLDQYPVISVADMYDLANITDFPYTYNDYGWKTVASAKVVRVNEGYLLKMPIIVPIK